VEQRT